MVATMASSISGFHTLIYSDDADHTRAFFRDVMGWSSVDSGGGWLIFKTPPSELGVHPTADDAGGEPWARVPLHQASLMCDDIHAAVAELRAKGVEVTGEIEDRGFGLVTSVAVPGAGWMQLYEPRHAIAHQLEG
jgi:catechol 2,3-dioxygenase-like lactoylglutathione lyase family enzyme